MKIRKLDPKIAENGDTILTPEDFDYDKSEEYNNIVDTDHCTICGGTIEEEEEEEKEEEEAIHCDECGTLICNECRMCSICIECRMNN